MILNKASTLKLSGVHPDLAAVINEAAGNLEGEDLFVITEGLRAYARQLELFRTKKSRTMRSRHLAHPSDGLSRAVDLAIWEDRDEDRVVDSGELTWKKEKYDALSIVVKAAAERLGIPIRWGGDFNGFYDGPHFELSWETYP